MTQQPPRQPAEEKRQSTGNLGQKKAKAEEISDCKFEHMGETAEKENTKERQDKKRSG